ncbi:MAG TPA: hypothetical protein VES19_03440, partial [Candidatus Limnocylindrales bacterium]|nr:hypothetical protein [Candidatus Limnocylindrales bacterium]
MLERRCAPGLLLAAALLAAAPSSSPVAAAETEPSTVPPLLAQEIRLDALPDMVWGDPKVLLPYA